MPTLRPRRRLVLAGGAAALLAGCGFRLRKAPDFAFDSLVMNAADTSPLGLELRRQIAANGKVQVLSMVGAGLAAAAPSPFATPAPPTSPAGPTSAALTAPNRAVFDLLQEQREKVVVGLNATGQVREFQLRLRVQFRLRTPNGRELIPVTELLQQRDISFNEGAVLAKEAEETLLFRDMQTDLVQQIMRRLAALKAL